jgi:hypothetical protein
MANLLHLPMEIHVRISKLLSLQDYIAYMHVSAVTHDAVLCVRPQMSPRLRDSLGRTKTHCIAS